MKSLTNDNEWIWDKNKFINRKYIMQENYQNYTDGDESEVPKVTICFVFLHNSFGQPHIVISL